MLTHPTAEYHGRQLFLVEGTLSELQMAATKTELLNKLASRLRHHGANADPSLAARHQALAEETCLFEFDDHHTHIFAAQLDGLTLYGMFDNANQLADGDVLRAVVARSGDLHYVHSVIRSADDLMLLPYGVYAGEQALVRSNRRAMWALIVGVWAVFEVALLVSMYAEGYAISATQFIAVSIMLLAMCAALGRLGHGSPYQIMPGGELAQAIFTVYGFPLPHDFNAHQGIALFPGRSSPFYETNAQVALARHRTRFRLGA